MSAADGRTSKHPLMSLWVVDDNHALPKQLQAELQGRMDVCAFEDTETCLKVFLACDEEPAPAERQDGGFFVRKPNIILTELVTKGMNGLELLEAILPNHPDISAYLYSSVLTEDVIRKAGRLGVKGCLEKPLEWQDLRKILK